MISLMLYAAVGLLLFVAGLATVMLRQSMFYQLLGINVCGAGLFLLMVTLARLAAETGAIGAPDPVLHALVLTGIVVAVSATALGLALLRKKEHIDEAAPPPIRDDGGEQ